MLSSGKTIKVQYIQLNERSMLISDSLLVMENKWVLLLTDSPRRKSLISILNAILPSNYH